MATKSGDLRPADYQKIRALHHELKVGFPKAGGNSASGQEFFVSKPLPAPCGRCGVAMCELTMQIFAFVCMRTDWKNDAKVHPNAAEGYRT